MTGSPNALQHIMGLDPETGAYRNAHMLRRMAQYFIMQERGIKGAHICAEIGVSRETMSLYFRGRIWGGNPHAGENAEQAEARREEMEDKVEQAIEKLSKQRRFLVPRVIGTPDESYLSDQVFIPELMRAPAH